MAEAASLSVALKFEGFDTAKFLAELPALEMLNEVGKQALAELLNGLVELINSGRFANFVARPTEAASEYLLEAVPSAEYLALLSAFAARQHEFSGGGHG